MKSWCSVALLCGAGAGEGGSMVLRNLFVWKVSNLSEFLQDAALLATAKKAYEQEFEEYCEVNKKCLEGLSQEDKFTDFIGEYLEENEFDTYQIVMEEFTKTQGYEACVCESTYNDNGDYYELTINQIVPESKEDILELVHVYMKEQGQEELLEIVDQGILNKLGE